MFFGRLFFGFLSLSENFHCFNICGSEILDIDCAYKCSSKYESKNMIGPHERTFSSSPSYPCSRICTLVLLLLPGLQGGVPACLQPSTGPLSPFQVWRRLIVERGRREALCPLTPTCTASPRWWWSGLNWDQRGEVVSLVALEGGRWELDTRIPDIALFTNSTGQLTLVHFEGREFSYWTSSSSSATFPAQITTSNWETKTPNISFTVDTRRPMDLLNTISYFSPSAFETLPPSWLPIARLLREDHGFRDHISQVFRYESVFTLSLSLSFHSNDVSCREGFLQWPDLFLTFSLCMVFSLRVICPHI